MIKYAAPGIIAAGIAAVSAPAWVIPVAGLLATVISWPIIDFIKARHGNHSKAQ